MLFYKTINFLDYSLLLCILIFNVGYSVGYRIRNRLTKHDWEIVAKHSPDNYIKENYTKSSLYIQTDKINYDSKANILWMKFDLNLDGIIENSGIRIMIPTEKGFIKITGYSLRKDFSEYYPIFLKIAKSIQPSTSL